MWQDYVGGAPTLGHADGILEGLPFRDARQAVMSRRDLVLTLQDGRQTRIFVTDSQGSFIASAPVA